MHTQLGLCRSNLPLQFPCGGHSVFRDAVPIVRTLHNVSGTDIILACCKPMLSQLQSETSFSKPVFDQSLVHHLSWKENVRPKICIGCPLYATRLFFTPFVNLNSVFGMLQNLHMCVPYAPMKTGSSGDSRILLIA